KSAFNALLKTLEEPPSHIIFILATTEPHKLPPTIRSRCQRFDFRRIPVGIITGLLEKVATAEKFTFDKPALKMIARAAEGGMRDAFSILDQCAAFGQVNTTNVASTLGGTDMGMVLKLTAFIAKYDEKNALETLRHIIDSGADTRALIGDLADVFRAMMWLAAGADIEADESLKPLAKTFGKNACERALNILLQKEYEMRRNLRANIVLETAVMAIMSPQDDADASDIVRLEKLEGRLKTLENEGVTITAAPAATPTPKAANIPKPEPTPKAAESPKAEKPKPKPKATTHEDPEVPKKTSEQDAPESGEIWEKLITNLEKEAYSVFTNAKHAKRAVIVGNMLEITFESDDWIYTDFIKSKVAQTALKAQLEKIAPQVLSVSILTQDSAEESGDIDVLKMFGTDIERI
ncbi:MAG: hypothetical protein HN948_10100, partial [Clostridia bacterium]|nr:hypothetical protein [Clostridia bacterium]